MTWQVVKNICRQFKAFNQLVLFLMVGGINTLFGYSLYALLIYLDLHYALASLFSTVGGVLFNFKTTGVVVFQNNNNRLLFRFISVYAFNYFWGLGLLRILSDNGVDLYLAGGILILPGALVAYVLQKKFVFGGKKNEVHQHNDPVLQRGR